MKTNVYHQICHPGNLNLAYAQFRKQAAKWVHDQAAVTEYERCLELNLDDLARRLREGAYYPVSARAIDDGEGSFSESMRMIEDQIVQLAVFNAIGSVFEPIHLACSYSSYRNRGANLAVEQMLDYRDRGDRYVVSGDISEAEITYDDDHLIYLFGAQLNDPQLLHLIRMWLNCGQALPWAKKIERRSLAPMSGHPSSPVELAVRLLWDQGAADHWDEAEDWALDGRRYTQEARDLLKRLGLDAARIGLESALLALASNPRYRHLFTKRNIALAAAAALTVAAYPAASKILGEKMSIERSRRISAPSGLGQPCLISPLAGLMTDLALHRFDVSITGIELHLVRYYDKFVISAPTETRANFAVDQARWELSRMGILLSHRQIHLARFKDGVEFLGYRLDPDQNRIDLIETGEQAQFDHWFRHFSELIRQAPENWPPAIFQKSGHAGGTAKDRLNAGFRQIKSMIFPDRTRHRRINRLDRQ